MENIDEATNLMIESGLHQFYTSFTDFKRKLTERHDVIKPDEDGDDVQAMTLEQLRRPMILTLCLCGVAAVILIVEILVVKWIQWDPYS